MGGIFSVKRTMALVAVWAGFHTRPAFVHHRRYGVAGAAGGGAARKGGTPGEGSPFDPLLRFFSDGVFRALRRAARAPPLDPARFFVKKRGKKLLNANSPPTQTPRRGGE